MNAVVEELRCGIYEHYKGEHYLVVGVARDDETEQLLVIYSRLYRRNGIPLSARKLADFLGETRDESGRLVRRFRYIGLEDSPR